MTNPRNECSSRSYRGTSFRNDFNQPREASFNCPPDRLVLAIEPTGSSSLCYHPLSSIDGGHGPYPVAAIGMANSLGIVRRISEYFPWASNRSPSRSWNPTCRERWLIDRRIMDIRRYDHTGDRSAVPLDEKADLRAVNASVPAIA